MPSLSRHKPSLGLHRAVTATEQTGLKIEHDQYLYDNDQPSTDSEMDLPAQKTGSLPPRHKLRLATSSPILHQLYQSDEEQPSPSADEFTDSNDEASRSESASDGGESNVEEDDMDFEDDFDTPRALPVTITPSALAVAVPVLAYGRPTVITISKLAPMAKRITPIIRPQSASYTTIRKFKAPLPTPVRTSAAFDQDLKVPQKPSPPERTDSLSPPSSYTSSRSSPSFSSNSSFTEEEQELDEADLLIRESDEIQSRSQSVLAGTEWDVGLEAPTPTSYAEYDPFALSPPTLVKSKEYVEVSTPTRTKRWRTFGMRRPKAVR